MNVVLGICAFLVIFILVLCAFFVTAFRLGDHKRRLTSGCVDGPPWSGVCSWTAGVQFRGTLDSARAVALDVIQRNSPVPVVEVEPHKWIGWTSSSNVRGSLELGISIAEIDSRTYLLKCSCRPRWAIPRLDFGQSRKAAETMARSIVVSMRV